MSAYIVYQSLREGRRETGRKEGDRTIPESSDSSQVREHLSTGNKLHHHVEVRVVLQGDHLKVTIAGRQQFMLLSCYKDSP